MVKSVLRSAPELYQKNQPTLILILNIFRVRLTQLDRFVLIFKTRPPEVSQPVELFTKQSSMRKMGRFGQ